MHKASTTPFGTLERKALALSLEQSDLVAHLLKLSNQTCHNVDKWPKTHRRLRDHFNG
jgi:hypothetical protein